MKVRYVTVKNFEELADLVVDGLPLFPKPTTQTTTCQIGLFSDDDETTGQRRLDGNEAISTRSDGRT